MTVPEVVFMSEFRGARLPQDHNVGDHVGDYARDPLIPALVVYAPLKMDIDYSRSHPKLIRRVLFLSTLVTGSFATPTEGLYRLLMLRFLQR